MNGGFEDAFSYSSGNEVMCLVVIQIFAAQICKLQLVPNPICIIFENGKEAALPKALEEEGIATHFIHSLPE